MAGWRDGDEAWRLTRPARRHLRMRHGAWPGMRHGAWPGLLSDALELYAWRIEASSPTKYTPGGRLRLSRQRRAVLLRFLLSCRAQTSRLGGIVWRAGRGGVGLGVAAGQHAPRRLRLHGRIAACPRLHTPRPQPAMVQHGLSQTNCKPDAISNPLATRYTASPIRCVSCQTCASLAPLAPSHPSPEANQDGLSLRSTSRQ